LRPLNEMVPLARAEARKALELVPSHPRAHSLLGGIAALHDYDWKEAEEQYRLAKASQSLPPEVHDGYAQCYLVPLGRFEEAIQERARAIAQDPLNALWHSNQANTFLCAEMYESAIAQARKALEIDERHYFAHGTIALCYISQGKLAEAREWAEEAARLAPWNPTGVAFLAALLSEAGEKNRAENLLATIPGAIPSGMIFYHLIRSEIDAALDCYQRVIELRQPIAAMMASAGFLKPLRASPRWPKLARMMNLPNA